jgi:predicted dehydrogenase
VGLIGCGWYGKTDLFRLIQVSPVEVVSLCDVDSRMLADAAELTSQRQASHEKPRTYSDYRKMLVEKDLDIVLVGTPEVLQIGTRRQSSARMRLSGLDGLQPEG